jgi:hypothetical protein
MLSNNEQRERKSRIAAIAVTILVHALILISLIFFSLHTRIPLTEEESVQISFGYNNDSFVDTQQLVPTLTPNSLLQTGQKQVENQMITKKDAEPTAIEKSIKKTVNPETAAVGKPTAIVETPHEQTIIRKPKTSVKSNTTSTPNNQSVTAKPSGQGIPGETQLSPKSNNNDGKVSGVSFELGGRGSLSLQKPVFNPPVEGKIIVTIIVNREGKVIFASAATKGTTISDYRVREQAEIIARKAVFAPNKNAPAEQRGTITYVFVK